MKSVSAFANGKGGVLFFGVADDETLVGLTFKEDVRENRDMLNRFCEALQNEKWNRHRQDWGQLHSQVKILFEERLSGL